MKNDIYLETMGEVDFNKFPEIIGIENKGKGFIVKTKGKPGDFLKSLVESTEVVEFRLVYPSLEEIFIEEVQGE